MAQIEKCAIGLNLFLVCKSRDKETRHHCRSYNAGDIRAHCVHKKEVRRIGFLPFNLRDSGGHRHCRYACGTD